MTARTDREAALAAALRANLKRRKAQSRAADDTASGEDVSAASRTTPE